MKTKQPAPDYNPEDIPILDDIIEKGITDDTGIESIDDITETEDEVTEAARFDINAFLDNAGMDSENTITAETGPQPGELDGILETQDNTAEIQFAYEESSEIEFYQDDDEDALDDSMPEATVYYADEDDYESGIDVQADEPADQAIIEPISVGTIVKDIVREMMPDLEQQLVFMLQKAIEEKLPRELIKSSDTGKHTNNAIVNDTDNDN
ncbi:MAG: hypothetical protein LJE83_02850 [Gammaproteobacteria bacterium]|nr:hypothetical protein [Gammaproteobacteria bacterium]